MKLPSLSGALWTAAIAYGLILVYDLGKLPGSKAADANG